MQALRGAWAPHLAHGMFRGARASESSCSCSCLEITTPRRGAESGYHAKTPTGRTIVIEGAPLAESRVVPSQGSGTVMRSTSTPRDDSTSNTSNLHPTNPLPSRPGGTTAPRGLPSREQAQGYSPLANSLEHPKSWRAATNFPARATPPETRTSTPSKSTTGPRLARDQHPAEEDQRAEQLPRGWDFAEDQRPRHHGHERLHKEQYRAHNAR